MTHNISQHVTEPTAHDLLLKKFETFKDVEDAIEKFELDTCSKFSVYYKDKIFGSSRNSLIYLLSLEIFSLKPFRVGVNIDKHISN